MKVLKPVLICDDEVHNRDLFSQAFELTEEFSASIAEDGARALTKANKEKYDLICTDFRMPKLNGAQLITGIHKTELNRITPIIVITGYIEEAKAECTSAGVLQNVIFLAKPLSPGKLVHQAQSILCAPVQRPARPATGLGELIVAFVQSATETITMMGQANDIRHTNPFRVNPSQRLGVDISGVISILSPELSGTLSLCFPSGTFLKIVAKMLAEEFSEITADNADAVAELCNIIYGNVKKVLDEKGFEFAQTLPAVVRGENARLFGTGEVPAIAVPFECDLGPFFVILCLKPHLPSAKHQSP
ncbi:MAG: response regulator [Deltaproteobacteria bacterium]|nr:response regulator [Deltaproteobacteria bacterium]